jgi:signal transduction histidine kinase
LNVELLDEEVGAGGGEARALLRAVKNEVDRLTALSERYLSVARRKPPRVEAEDIGQICRDALDAVRADLERSGVSVELAVEPEVPPVLVDEGQIRQALLNLLRNAREAMPHGGRVLVGARKAVNGAEITVDDEGDGIDAEARAHLFERLTALALASSSLVRSSNRTVARFAASRVPRRGLASPSSSRWCLPLPAFSPR